MSLNLEFNAVLQLLAMLLGEPRTGLLIGLLIAAAWSDYGTGRIPNALVFGGALVALAYGVAAPPPHTAAGEAFLAAAAGMAVGLISTLPFYLLRAMGAGDVKLMSMCGAFLGYPAILPAVLGTFMAGGALALLYLGLTGRLRQALLNIAGMGTAVAAGHAPTLETRTSAGSLPYGIAIAIGTIGYLLVRQLGILH